MNPRAFLFALLFYPGTLAYVFAGIAVSLVGQRPMRAVVHGWSKYHYWLARRILGISTRIEGAIPSGPVLIASKHQSMYETIEMLRIAETPVVVMKRELAYMPLFGALARRYGVISVDREAGAKALREMLAAEGPYLLHVKIDSRANVWPLVPPNSPNHKMMEKES